MSYSSPFTAFDSPSLLHLSTFYIAALAGPVSLVLVSVGWGPGLPTEAWVVCIIALAAVGFDVRYETWWSRTLTILGLVFWALCSLFVAGFYGLATYLGRPF